jgi:hypothetical protein
MVGGVKGRIGDFYDKISEITRLSGVLFLSMQIR